MLKTLKIKPMSPLMGKYIPFPEYATSGSAGMDLRACTTEDITIAPSQRVSIPTGIAIELPSAEYVALVCARSGLAVKSGITLSNCVGVIDSDYRGEILVSLINQSDAEYTVSPGERIAQLLIMPVCVCSLKVCDELSSTVRGEGGFGSTGRN